EQRAVDLHRQVLAAAERAADACEMDTHLFWLQVQTRRDLVAIHMQPLRRDVDVHATLAVRYGKPRLRPEERLVLDPDFVDTGNRHLALDLRVAVPDHERADDVRTRILPVAVPHRRPVWMKRLLLRRPFRID